MAETKEGMQQRNRSGEQHQTTTTRRGQLARPEEQQGLMTPFSFMRRFSEDLDRLFDDVIRNPFGAATGREHLGLLSRLQEGMWSPQIEVFQRGSDFVVRAELPGLNKDDVKVEINDDLLMIQGERKQEHEETRGGVFHSERHYGSFYRSIPLPEGVIPESADATFKNGVLEIKMQAPPAEMNKGRRLEIKDANQEQKGK